jgi:DNA-binding NarL/FixJ family response regulator
VARVVAYVPDLLFGSNVLGMLQAGGHEAKLASQPGDVEAALAGGDGAPAEGEGARAGVDVLVVDLTADAPERIEQVRALAFDREATRVLAFYSHVETDVRSQGEQAGFDMVVPRSRMAREGAQLVQNLSER